MSRRAQLSFEYLLVVGFALLLIAPLIVVYYTQTTRLGDETASATIERAVTQIVEAADTVYYLGAPSVRTITVDLPAGVESATFSNTSLIISLRSAHGAYEQVGWSVATLNGTIPLTPGPHTLVVAALPDDTVSITER